MEPRVRERSRVYGPEVEQAMANIADTLDGWGDTTATDHNRGRQNKVAASGRCDRTFERPPATGEGSAAR